MVENNSIRFFDFIIIADLEYILVLFIFAAKDDNPEFNVISNNVEPE